MESFKESEIKYLAGLLDADGSLSFKFCKSSSGKVFVYLTLGLSASDKIDKHGYLESLGDRVGKCCKIHYEKETFSDATKWNVQSRTDLNKLLPRITKHMVVKGSHWKRLFDKYSDLKGVDVSDQVSELKEFSESSRKDTGPIKAKNHPTWAWVAGYLDGDGCYSIQKGRLLHVSCIAHKDDLEGVSLLQKAFGGSLYEAREDNTRLWRRGLGPSHRSFAISFLKKVHKHSRLKKWKIEQLIAFHSQPQRLTEIDPKG